MATQSTQQGSLRRHKWRITGAITFLIVIAWWFRRGIAAWAIFLFGGGNLSLEGGYPYTTDWTTHALPDCKELVPKSLLLVVQHPCLAQGPSDRFWMDVEIGHTVYRGPYRREIALPAVVFCNYEIQSASPRFRIADLDRKQWFGWSNKEAYDLRTARRLSITLLAMPIGDGTERMILEIE
jgi:hypothetical protein